MNISRICYQFSTGRMLEIRLHVPIPVEHKCGKVVVLCRRCGQLLREDATMGDSQWHSVLPVHPSMRFIGFTDYGRANGFLWQTKAAFIMRLQSTGATDDE